MIIKSRPYGHVEINDEDIITFEKGLIGFTEMRKFVLLGDPKVNEIFVWLQSLDNEDLAFIVVQPRFFRPDYNPRVRLGEVEDLGSKDDADLLLYAIVVIPEDVSKMTANLLAPIIINVKNNKAKQILLSDSAFSVKEYILPQDREGE